MTAKLVDDVSGRILRPPLALICLLATCVIAPSLLNAAQASKAPARKRPVTAPAPPPRVEPWPTWGGPRRDFIVPSSGLASKWPDAGPPRVWSRALGDGYSGIAEENGILYTAYRRGSDDVVTALEAQSGKTIWETAYAAPFTNQYKEAVGPGPYAMPQVVGEPIFTDLSAWFAELDKFGKSFMAEGRCQPPMPVQRFFP